MALNHKTREAMIRVKIELWLWLGRELGGDFHSPSDMRSEMTIDIPEGDTVQTVFGQLARNYPAFAAKVFDRQSCICHGNLMVTLNDRAFSPDEIYDQVLQDGDKVMVMPLYVGG